MRQALEHTYYDSAYKNSIMNVFKPEAQDALLQLIGKQEKLIELLKESMKEKDELLDLYRRLNGLNELEIKQLKNEKQQA